MIYIVIYSFAQPLHHMKWALDLDSALSFLQRVALFECRLSVRLAFVSALFRAGAGIS